MRLAEETFSPISNGFRRSGPSGCPSKAVERFIKIGCCVRREKGAQTAVFRLQQYEIERRHATLVAILVEATATLTDEILDLYDRMIGSFFTEAKNKHEKTFAAAGKAINEKLRLYAKVGSALIDTKEKGCDLSRRLKLSSRGRS